MNDSEPADKFRGSAPILLARFPASPGQTCPRPQPVSILDLRDELKLNSRPSGWRKIAIMAETRDHGPRLSDFRRINIGDHKTSIRPAIRNHLSPGFDHQRMTIGTAPPGSAADRPRSSAASIGRRRRAAVVWPDSPPRARPDRRSSA